MKGKVVSIKMSEKKGAQKRLVSEATLMADFGIEGDHRAGQGKKQVSLLAIESLYKITSQTVKGLCSGKFSENIATEGIALWELETGTKLFIGETVLEISQVGKECHDGCPIKAQVGQCIMPKEGIFTKVIKGGEIRVGDDIRAEQINDI